MCPCFGRSEIPKPAVSFDILPIIQGTFFANCWLYYLFQSVNLKHSVFSGPSKLNWLIHSLLWRLDSSGVPKCIMIEKVQCSSSTFFIITGFKSSTKVTLEKSCFNGLLFQKNYHVSFCVAALIRHKCQNGFWHGPFSTLELTFLQSEWLHFFSRSQLLIVLDKFISFTPGSGILMEQKIGKVLLVWQAWLLKLILQLRSTCFFSIE